MYMYYEHGTHIHIHTCNICVANVHNIMNITCTHITYILRYILAIAVSEDNSANIRSTLYGTGCYYSLKHDIVFNS